MSGLRAPAPLAGANLALLVLFPLAWAAPLVEARLIPFLDGDRISILSGVAALWEDEPGLAALVALFGIALPYAKTLALAAVHFGRLGVRWMPALEVLGKLSMADVFLVALGVIVAKGVGLGRVETAWGLPLFAGCVLASLAISLATPRRTTKGER
ncbi:paraquat-inducible protein A [Albimonas sp. CAU 1670]|uniref:paraquat-inducible protein A n=1 Tax=Albimonas sp. CAU 1670 TaxID=3032599 RepID=UPI0023DC31BC|nr:paraquat-inducible protein A [Albimonas sp. CAU 1670]MDF2232016.1 paraquat-inducible protein A [Albimonas sp. CAU 1670]